MGIDVEHTKVALKDGHESKERPKKWGGAIFVVSLIAVGAILVALLPDYGNKNRESETNQETETTRSAAFFESDDGPFTVKIPLFSSNITSGYSNASEAKHDFEQLAKFLLNGIITSNAQDRPVYVPDENFVGSLPTAGITQDSPAADSSATADSSAKEDPGSVGDATDFETNKQEEDVDRADRTKSSGEFVFTAYSDYILVWTVDTGDLIATLQMPPIQLPKSDGDQQKQEDVVDPVESITRSSDIAYYNPKPYIQALLLEGDKLTVITSGYGYGLSLELDEPSVLYDYLDTLIQVYDINGGDIAQISTKYVNGSFRDAFSVDGNAHIVTQSGLNTYEYLVSPLQRYHPRFTGMSDEEYLAEATRMAELELIPHFVEQLLASLDGVDLARLSLFAETISGKSDIENAVFAEGLANAVTQVFSFDMMGTIEEELATSTAACFQPSSWGYVYASQGMIIVAGESWNWIQDFETSGQTTYFVGFEVDGASSTPALVGSVPGYLISPYAIDFVEGYLRIATTMRLWSFSVFEDFVAEEPPPEKTSVVETSSTKNQIIVLRIPSSTDDETARLEEVGRLELGKINEVFTAVRFFDDIAYAVTFEQRDPFYVVNLEDPEKPSILGELDVSGFSSYLHSINENKTMILAVGQEADNDGTILGLQITLFDATDPVNPVDIDRFVVEKSKNQYSSSSVEWDERAFRYLSLGDNRGRLIIPMTITSWNDSVNNFDGFAVYAVENNKISHAFDISHTDPQTLTAPCYCGSLPERSFVFKGDVMTLKGHTVISTDLDSGDLEWMLPVDVDEAGDGVCCYW